MTINFITISSGARSEALQTGGGTASRTHLTGSTPNSPQQHRIVVQPGPNGAGSVAAPSYSSSPVPAVQGEVVVVSALVEAAGASLVILESANGSTWTTAGTFPLPASERAGVRFVPGAGCSYWRAQVLLTQSCSRLTVTSEVHTGIDATLAA